MILRQLKLQPTKAQEAEFERWLWHLTGVWNWAVNQLRHSLEVGEFPSQFTFRNRLANHGSKLNIPGHTLQGLLADVHVAWKRCLKKQAKRPRLKGQRNKLNHIPFPDPIRFKSHNRVAIQGIGSVRFHKQQLPGGKVKCGRIVKRASGWYLCLFIEAEPNSIPAIDSGAVGIDPGFSTLATLSTGEKLAHPNELKKSAARLGQAQRGKRRKLTARIKEREANQRKDRNHKLSRRLVAENEIICWSKDSHKAIARTFGKSVASAGHGQLRQMIAYKCTASGRQIIEVPSKNSTKTCSACGALTGPTGYAGLSVRQWECSVCGAAHDRDVNAAINTLHAGLGLSHERRREATSERVEVNLGQGVKG